VVAKIAVAIEEVVPEDLCPSLLWLLRTTRTPQFVISSRMQETFEECIYGKMHTDDIWYKRTFCLAIPLCGGLTHTHSNFKLEY